MRTKRVVSVVAIVLSAVSLGAVGAELRLIDAAKRSDVEAVRALVEQGLGAVEHPIFALRAKRAHFGNCI